MNTQLCNESQKITFPKDQSVTTINLLDGFVRYSWYNGTYLQKNNFNTF